MWMRVWVRGWPWNPWFQLPRAASAPRFTSTWTCPHRLTRGQRAPLLPPQLRSSRTRVLLSLNNREFHHLMFSPGDGCKRPTLKKKKKKGALHPILRGTNHLRAVHAHNALVTKVCPLRCQLGSVGRCEQVQLLAPVAFLLLGQEPRRERPQGTGPSKGLPARLNLQRAQWGVSDHVVILSVSENLVLINSHEERECKGVRMQTAHPSPEPRSTAEPTASSG